MDPWPTEAVAAKEGVGTCGRQESRAENSGYSNKAEFVCERESTWQDFVPGIEAVSLSAALCVQ